MARVIWKSLRPDSLRKALELCKEHAREKRNLSVERIAEEMGVTDHWTLYKWINTGRIPANMIRPYETACGIDYVMRWLVASSNKLIIDLPTGRHAKAADMQVLQELMTTCAGQLLAFYGGKANAHDALTAIQNAMEGLAWHRGNVEKHSQPELELGGNP